MLSRDILAIPPEEIDTAEVELTVFGGRPVFAAAPSPAWPEPPYDEDGGGGALARSPAPQRLAPTLRPPAPSGAG